MYISIIFSLFPPLFPFFPPISPTSSLGRVVNRFSKDLNTIDEMLPRTFNSYFRTLSNVAGIILVISISTPIFLAAVIPLGAIYFYVQRYYLATSRELKRLDAVTRSPIFSHFGESLNGVASIRAYGHQRRFVEENERKADGNQKAYYPSIAANRWYGKESRGRRGKKKGIMYCMIKCTLCGFCVVVGCF